MNDNRRLRLVVCYISNKIKVPKTFAKVVNILTLGIVLCKGCSLLIFVFQVNNGYEKGDGRGTDLRELQALYRPKGH